jgi:hypothetical protein
MGNGERGSQVIKHDGRGSREREMVIALWLLRTASECREVAPRWGIPGHANMQVCRRQP